MARSYAPIEEAVADHPAGTSLADQLRGSNSVAYYAIAVSTAVQGSHINVRGTAAKEQ